jgi:hypothetical protein
MVRKADIIDCYGGHPEKLVLGAAPLQSQSGKSFRSPLFLLYSPRQQRFRHGSAKFTSIDDH